MNVDKIFICLDIFPGLAVSDFLFCATTLLSIYVVKDDMIFSEKGISFFLTVYEEYFLNLFIKISTSVTVVMTVYRHLAIAFPFTAKQNLTARNTFFAVVASFAFWIIFLLPLLWTWKVYEHTCPDGTPYYILDIGPFEDNKMARKALTHMWSIIGFILPACVLGYCNVHLLLSLRHSYQSHRSVVQSIRQQHRLIAERLTTITLIAIVVSYFVLVLPSEALGYFMDFTTETHNNHQLTMAQVTCNALQAINMSMNVVLYCSVNANFRRSCRSMLPSCQQGNMSSYDTIPLDRQLNDTSKVNVTEL